MSNHEAIQRLADRYVSDPEFRQVMARDPEGAAQSSGVTLDDATRQAIKGVDWAGFGEGLSSRVSKRFYSRC